MQTLTFTQKLLRQRNFLRSLIPLFAIFIGMVTSNRAFAQFPVLGSSTAAIRSVIVTAGTSSATATTDTYNAVLTTGGTTTGGGIFAGTDFGSLDFGSGSLLLQGGTVVITEMAGETYNDVYISYGVAQGTAQPAIINSNSIQLAETSYIGNTRTFALSNAARNILALATAGGAGTLQRFDITVNAFGTNTNNNPVYVDGTFSRRTASFTTTGSPVFTPTLTATTVFVSANGAANTTYNANNVSNAPNFNGANLGTFDVNTGQLVLNGGTATTTENGPNMVSGVTLYYRVRGSGTGGLGFTQVPLTQGTPSSSGGITTRTFSLSMAAQNLLAGIGQLGLYNVDVYFEASIFNSSTNTTSVVSDNKVGNYYVANFTVNGTVFQTTTWTGGMNDNWFDPGNWDNGVPAVNKNAIIPNFASGNTKLYPNIYSDAIKPPTGPTTVTNPDGTNTIIPGTPGFDNTATGPRGASGNAQVRNLTLQGNDQLDRSILRLIVGRLDVFGDFTNPQGSFIQRAVTVISFKAEGAQTISGSINGFVGVEIDGGVNSVKTLTNSFAVKSGGFLKFINGILQTNIALVSSNFISFEGESADNTGPVSASIPASQLIGETETSFFRGFLTTTQLAPVGSRQNFSNIGLALSFTTNDPGNVTVTRNNGGNYPSTAFGGKSPKPGIRRVFGVQPSNVAGLSAKLEFRYLTNELCGLENGNPGGATTCDDATKLSLYVSNSAGDTFTQLGRDTNVNNVLTKNVVTNFATFTLNETSVPLPVTLTKFDAKRAGADAVVTWETASELNNKGYNVQVSTDGTTFRTIEFVASESANSVSTKSYIFTDTEKNKVGVRYYRLQQLDLDGKTAFFAPRAVTFEGRATEAGIVAYPNPYTTELRIGLSSAVSGNALARITDMTGRVISQQVLPITIGSNDLPVENINGLKEGLYMLNLTLPSGESKTMKVVKQ